MSESEPQREAGAAPFLDTNVLVYLLSDDLAKVQVAERVLGAGGVVSVQVLNEFASVAMRKARLALLEVRELLLTIRRFCRVVPVTVETHDLALALCDRYGYAIYDSSILAAALLAECPVVMTEDMQTDQIVMDALVIRNPFLAAA